MELPNQKEQFSIAYVRAIVSVAGFVISRQEVDEDSVDLTLSARGVSGTYRSPKIDIQLKCTARDLIHDDHLHFPLPRKNYDELRGDRFLVPRLLVVVTVPEALDDWLAQSEEELILRRCGYWMSLRDAPETSNTETVTVYVPRSNLFTAPVLKNIMQRIADGGRP
jgi:hypothetical protein